MGRDALEATDVARYLLHKAGVAGEPITNLKLQKLLYYAYGHVLECTGEKLFDEQLEAWQHGPVVRSVYAEFCDFGRSRIVCVEQPDQSRFSRETRVMLDAVCNAYMAERTLDLRNQTHREVPWKKTYRKDEKREIPDAVMCEQFPYRDLPFEPLTSEEMDLPVNWDGGDVG